MRRRRGADAGITVNAISPGARTRMSAPALDAGFREGASDALDLRPEHVARVVAYLASEDAGDITGRIIHAAGGAVREYTTTRTGRSELVARLRAGPRLTDCGRAADGRSCRAVSGPELGRALGAERGEALGGVVGGEQLGDGLALEVDGVGEREEGAALHEVLRGAVRQRRTGRELPGQALGHHERGSRRR